MADETDAFPAEEEADSELESQEPAAKRKKSAPFMKKVDGIQSRLDAKVKKLSSTEALIDKMQDKQRNIALTKKEQSSLERWRSTSASLVTEVNTLRTELKEAQEEANSKKAAAEAAAAAAAEKKELEAEMKREYSEAGTIAVINEKCKRDRNFDSNADNHDLVWQHVGEAVNKLTETGQLPASDRRHYKSHRAKYQQEYKFFKMWADKAQRAVEQSGVDMDELLEKVTDGQRPTTAIFLKWGYLMNVSVIPPYRINSDNAEGGGEGNPFRARDPPRAQPPLEAATDASAVSEHEEEEEDEELGGLELEEDDVNEGSRSGSTRPPTASSRPSTAASTAASTAEGATEASSQARAKPPNTKGPRPLNIGGSGGVGHSRAVDGRAATTADAMVAFTKAYEKEQDADRKLLKELQKNAEREAEKQRMHEKECISECKQQ